MKRAEDALSVVPYSPTLLRMLRSNMDLQVVFDAQAAMHYVCGYVGKIANNTHHKEIIADALADNMTADKVLAKAGNAILSQQVVGKIEAATIVLGLPLYWSSIASMNLNLNVPDERSYMLRARGPQDATQVSQMRLKKKLLVEN
jgi:hypothetical protein